MAKKKSTDNYKIIDLTAQGRGFHLYLGEGFLGNFACEELAHTKQRSHQRERNGIAEMPVQPSRAYGVSLRSKAK
ncbi:hypothetical protein A4G18_00620 [Pasteurellaceae bacterium Pebbles2]|nr:hypothetical protein [Pasteurellaceae bacterium Pebbles2]